MEQRHAGFRWLLIVIGLGLLILPLSTPAQSHEAANPLPAPTGPYRVGTTLFHWIDESRYEAIPALVAGNALQPGSAEAKISHLLIKAEPTLRSATVTTLNINQPVTVTEINGRWAHIEYGSDVGWVVADELFKVDTSPENKRELMVQVWYPSDVEARATPAPYLPDSDLVVKEFNTVLNGIYGLALAPDLALSLDFPSHAFPDAPLSTNKSSYPVLIFSHGLGGFPALYSAQLEEMASHGYIVFAIYHTYVTPITMFPDGRMATFSLPQSVNSYPGVYVHRVASEDQIFVADQLEELNDYAGSMFAGKMNLDMLGVFGHSMGGTAAVLSCDQDRRFKACVNEDGFAEDAFRQTGKGLLQPDKGIIQPFMYLQQESNPATDYFSALYRAVQGPGYNLILDGFGHLNFADFVWLPGASLGKNSFGLGSLPVGDIEGRRAVKIVRTYLLAFFDTYLKGEHNTLLVGSSGEYPEVSFSSRNTGR